IGCRKVQSIQVSADFALRCQNDNSGWMGIVIFLRVVDVGETDGGGQRVDGRLLAGRQDMPTAASLGVDVASECSELCGGSLIRSLASVEADGHQCVLVADRKRQAMQPAD